VTWIETLLASTEGSESPREYYYWAGLAAISAVVANNVYLDRFYYKLYPNIYVLLVGRSGLRKGPPVALAKALVEEVNSTRIFSGRTTIEGIINELSTAKTKNNGGPPILDARGMLVASEFASFIIQNDSALTILTDLYDRNYYEKAWDYATKGGGIQSLKSPYLTLLGASNETHFKDVIPQNALGGGFIARTFVIHADVKSNSNPLTERPEGIVSIESLSKQLKVLSQTKGEFVWSKTAKQLYNDWYREYDSGTYDDDTGMLERLGDSVLKVATLVSLSRDCSLELNERDVAEAIRKCMSFVPGARKVALGAQGKSPSKEGTAVILRFLLAHPEHSTTKTKLLQKFWGHFNADELKVIVDTLVVARAVKIEQKQVIAGRGLGYIEDYITLVPEVVARYNNLQREETT